MVIQLQTLLSELRADFDFYYTGPDDTTIFAVQLLDTSHKCHPKILYIAAKSTVLPDSQQTELTIIFADKNIIYDVYNKAQELIVQFMQQNQILESICSTNINSLTPNSLADLCADIMRNPVILFDADFLPLAWSADLKEGAYNFASISLLSNSYIQSKASSPMILEGNSDFKHRMLICGYLINGISNGYLITVEQNKPICASDLFYVNEICQKLSTSTTLQGIQKMQQTYTMESFLFDLLNNRFIYPEILKNKCKIFHISDEKKLYILSIDTTFQMSNLHADKYLSHIVGTDFYKYKHYYVALLICQVKDNICRNTFPGLSEFLIEHNLYAGISNGYMDIGKTSVAFKQSVKAIEIGIHICKSLHFYRFEDYLVSYLLENISEKDSLLDLCHPVTLRIYEYDRAHNTEYLLSLAAYILLEKSIQKSSNALHIHRNTMINRVNKLKRHFGIDFNDSRLRTKLHISILIFVYLGIIEAYSFQPI